VRELIRPHGTLILAIENRFGLKYWAGANEDHTGNLFEGLEGYERRADVRTWGREELQSLLRSHGFASTRFYYPFPDYKLPRLVYSDDWLPSGREMPPAAASFDQERLALFDEGKVAQGFAANGLIAAFAPSFLVVAR